MSSIYEAIGRFVVRFAWCRYGRQITIVGAVSASPRSPESRSRKRQPPEG